MRSREVLTAVVEQMRGFPAPWYIAGGWAIDLYLGRRTRPHSDVDLAIFREDQRAIHTHFPGWRVRKVLSGQFEAWRPAEWLSLPVHEIHVDFPEERRPVVEFLLNERADGRWLFRRDLEVTRPLEQAVLQAKDGTPYLSPAIVLIYKAKAPRPLDEEDFCQVRSALTPPDRQWLRNALQLVHPGHDWLEWLSVHRKT